MKPYSVFQEQSHRISSDLQPSLQGSLTSLQHTSTTRAIVNLCRLSDRQEPGRTFVKTSSGRAVDMISKAYMWIYRIDSLSAN